MTDAWWGNTQSVSPRFKTEVAAMKSHFGSTWKLVLPQPGSTDPLYWRGKITVQMAELVQRHAEQEHEILVVYPHSFPSSAPECYCSKPTLPPMGHIYGNSNYAFNRGMGKMCLFNPSEGVEHGWNPARSTALTIALWGIQWIYAYYVKKYTGEWPGDEHNTSHLNERRRNNDDDDGSDDSDAPSFAANVARQQLQQLQGIERAQQARPTTPPPPPPTTRELFQRDGRRLTPQERMAAIQERLNRGE